ncbi:hypothetical protein GA0115252_14931 [Streptomyces sp. DfronAA-171]|nr:hypothetical protein GA0115252_14931 [Streptomyces sp. DfronAA-171]
MAGRRGRHEGRREARGRTRGPTRGERGREGRREASADARADARRGRTRGPTRGEGGREAVRVPIRVGRPEPARSRTSARRLVPAWPRPHVRRTLPSSECGLRATGLRRCLRQQPRRPAASYERGIAFKRRRPGSREPGRGQPPTARGNRSESGTGQRGPAPYTGSPASYRLRPASHPGTCRWPAHRDRFPPPPKRSAHAPGTPTRRTAPPLLAVSPAPHPAVTPPGPALRHRPNQLASTLPTPPNRAFLAPTSPRNPPGPHPGRAFTGRRRAFRLRSATVWWPAPEPPHPGW